MQNPVMVVETGVTYDQRSIEQWWFKRNQRSCPATQRLVHSMALQPDTKLKEEIGAWLAQRPSYITTLEQEEELQQQLFPSVDSSAVAVHHAVEQVCGQDDGAKSAGLQALCDHLGWQELPATLLCTGAYLELLQVVNVGRQDDKAHALRCLRYVAKQPEGMAALCEAGFLDSTVAVMRDPECSIATSTQAVAVLLALASNVHNRAQLLYAGAVQGLVALLDSADSEQVADKAVKLLSKLAEVDVHDFRRQVQGAAGAGSSGLDALIDLLSSSSARSQQYALAVLLRLAAQETYRLELIEAGCATPPIRLLRSSTAVVCEYAAKLLYMFATGERSKLKLIEEVGIAPFAALLMSEHAACKRHGTSMLFQLIMGDDENMRGGPQDLPGPPEGSDLAQLLGLPTFVRGAGLPRQSAEHKVCQSIMEQGGVGVLVGLLSETDPETVEKAAMLLAHMAGLSKANVHLFMEAGFVKPAVSLLYSQSTSCAEQAAIAIGHLAVNSATKRMFVDAGAVRPLLLLAQHKSCREVADSTLRKLVGLTMHWYLLRTKAVA